MNIIKILEDSEDWFYYSSTSIRLGVFVISVGKCNPQNLHISLRKSISNRFEHEYIIRDNILMFKGHYGTVITYIYINGDLVDLDEYSQHTEQ